MTIEIAPTELAFYRPFTTEVQEILNLKNTSTSPIAFKVKTTAPKQYCVRPNSGRIEPGQDVDVTVILQAMKQEPPADAKCRDKFLVQSATITGEQEYLSVASVLEQTSKEDLQEKKIRVTWVQGGASPKPADTPKREPHSQDATAFSSPNGNLAPAAAPPVPVFKASDTASPPRRPDVTDTPPARSIPDIPIPQSKPAEVPAPVPAQESAGLRQRAVAKQVEEKPVAPSTEVVSAPRTASKPTDAGSLTTSHRNATEGVPVQIVAILCTVSFLLAYFFF